jgi:hypothetical protein
MTVRILTWDMSQFTRAQRYLYEKPGDFAEAYGLYHDGYSLRRAPQIPAETTTVLNTTAWKQGNNGSVTLIGAYDSNLYTLQLSNDGTQSSLTAISAAISTVTGIAGLNVVPDGNYVYLLGGGKPYYGSLTTGVALFQDLSLLALVAANNTIYGLTAAGDLYKLNADATAFESYLDATPGYPPVYAAPYKGNLLVMGVDGQKNTFFNYISLGTVPGVRTVASIPGAQTTTPQQVAIYRDELYFTQIYLDTAKITILLYKFDGSTIRGPLGRLETTRSSGENYQIGLTVWRDTLLLWHFTVSEADLPIYTQRLYTLCPDEGLIEFASGSLMMSESAGVSHLVIPTPNNILITAEIIEPGTPTLYLLKAETYAVTPYLITSWFDANAGGKLKQLQEIAVHLQDGTSDTTCNLYYRTVKGGWTLAGSGTGQYVSVAVQKDFYVLQLKVELSNATNKDVRIQAISARYSMDV